MANSNDAKDALNKANVAMQKYFNDALALRNGASESEIQDSWKNAVDAIMTFIDIKKELGEELTPYEKQCLGTFDAANMMVSAKISGMWHEKGCGCDEYKQVH